MLFEHLELCKIAIKWWFVQFVFTIFISYRDLIGLHHCISSFYIIGILAAE